MHLFLNVLAMEERAIQRAERRRQLEEAKQKREDEKLARKTNFGLKHPADRQ